MPYLRIIIYHSLLFSDPHFFLIGLLFLFFLLFQNSENKNLKKGKYVTTMIDTKWSMVPLVLEMAEYMAEESQHSLWSFVDSISELNPVLSDLGML